MTQILVVEDNADLAFGLRNNLEIEGYEVDVAETGPEGLQRARALGPDLIILDLMLPGLNGYRVLQALRAEGCRTPVLILTAKGEETDKVLGFRLGADDYVTKPFGVLELLARVEAILRRTRAPASRDSGAAGDAPTAESPAAPESFAFGSIVVEPAARTVRRGRAEVGLTPKEFDLLLALIRRRGAAVSRLELMRDVWGHRAAVVSRTVDTHIAELRRKLEAEPSNPEFILTVHKIGYRFRMPGAATSTTL